MQPNEVPPYPWHTVTTDYVTRFPKTIAGHDAVAVFVHELTKYVILVPCSKETSGTDWAQTFMDQVHVHFGLPTHVLSDRGTWFNGLFNQSLVAHLGYSWKLTTAHAPWSDGQTERPNRMFLDVLRHFVSADMQDWDSHLKTAQFAINNSWHESVKETPLFLNRGRHPKSPLTVKLPTLPSPNPASTEFAARMRALTATTKRCMLAAQQRQKRYCDESRTEVAYAVGTKVLLSTAHLDLKVLRAGTRKVAPNWVGPFPIIVCWSSELQTGTS